MILQEDHPSGTFQIRAYAPGEITINDRVYTRSLILTPDQLISDWRPQSLNEIQESDWDPVLALKPDFLIFGCGPRFLMPSSRIFAPLYQANISVDVMDSRAAARTFAALMAEGRNAATAILLQDKRI